MNSPAKGKTKIEQSNKCLHATIVSTLRKPSIISPTMKKNALLLLFGAISLFVLAEAKSKICKTIEEALQNHSTVTTLELRGQGLKSLPDLSSLVNLEKIDLTGNAFTTIPTQLYALPKLKTLTLSSNALTTLPADMSRFKALTQLRIDNNPFINPVAELKKVATIPNLVSLNFSANKVAVFPVELLKLSTLTELDLGFGSIKTLPADIDKLKNLKRLVLSKNAITNFPPAFFKLNNLENLDLSYNDFKAMQPEFEKLSLDVLDVSYNKNLNALPALKGMRYVNIKSTKLNAEKLKWSLGEGCTILM